jgi:hypothetical protein
MAFRIANHRPWSDRLPTLASVFLLLGFGSKQQDMGLGEVRTCPRCGNTSPWRRVREFRQFSLFFVPLARWGRRRLEVCDICGNAVEI